MQRIKGKIEGVAPILFSRMRSALDDKPKPKPTDKEKKTEALQRCHRDNSGIYLPHDMFKQSLLGGCKAADVKKGRKSYAPFLEALVFVDGNLYLGKQEPDDVYEHWGRIPPGPKGAAVMLRYPIFHTGWQADFSLVVAIDDGNTIEAVKQSLDAAGLLIGMGSWRPEFGRFVVREWAVEK